MTLLETAQAAFTAWGKGEATGNYDDFKALLSDEFHIFSHPLGISRGFYQGEAAKEKFQALIASREGAPNMLHFSNIVMTQNESTAVFMFDSRGEVAGGFPYQGWNAIALVIEHEKVVGFREYFGDVEPAWFRA
jgi:hypothetical protein